MDVALIVFPCEARQVDHVATSQTAVTEERICHRVYQERRATVTVIREWTSPDPSSASAGRICNIAHGRSIRNVADLMQQPTQPVSLPIVGNARLAAAVLRVRHRVGPRLFLGSRQSARV